MRTSPALHLDTTPVSFQAHLIQVDAHTVRVVVTGEVDSLTKDDMEQAIDRAWFTWPDLVVVDVTGVSFLSASSVGVLVRARAGAEARGATLVVRSNPGIVRWVLGFMDRGTGALAVAGSMGSSL